MRNGQTDMDITERQNLLKLNIIGGGKLTESSINYGLHETIMVNNMFNYKNLKIFVKMSIFKLRGQLYENSVCMHSKMVVVLKFTY